MAQLFDVIRMEKCSGLIIFASAETFKTQFILDQVQKASYARKPILSIYYKEDVTQIDIMTKVLLASSKKYEAWKEDIEKARDAVLDYAYQMIYGSDYLDSSSLDGDNIIQSDDCVWEILSDSEVEAQTLYK